MKRNRKQPREPMIFTGSKESALQRAVVKSKYTMNRREFADSSVSLDPWERRKVRCADVFSISRLLSFFPIFSKTSRCFFFSGLNPATGQRRLSALDSLAVPGRCYRADRKRRLALGVRLIRPPAGCPASIRNPFVGSDPFFCPDSRRVSTSRDRAFRAVRPPRKGTCHFSRGSVLCFWDATLVKNLSL